MGKCCRALLLFILTSACAAKAQSTAGSGACVTPYMGQSFVGLGTNKVACTLPQLYGADGLTFPPGGIQGPIDQSPNIGNQFGGAQVQQNRVSTSLNSNIAGQIALLPFVAPASGITFTFDKSLGIYAESQDSFGPIFSERASTIGRNRLAVGFSYQYLDFNSLDGINLRSFPTAFIQTQQAPSPNCPVNAFNPQCLESHDYITATNRIDLRVQQLVSFLTFGLTRRLDVSVAIPVTFVQLSATANATIQENSGFLGSTVFAGCNGISEDCGLQNTFSNARHAAGLGDVTLRFKGMIRRWERAGLAAGIDVRFPTGDAINLLGTGAFGIKPFVVWSYAGRLSPHVNLGYAWNGKSILGADVTAEPQAKGSLPGEFFYSIGVEGAVIKRLSVTLDLIGQRVFNGPVDNLRQVMAPSPCFSIAVDSQGDQCGAVGAQVTTISPGTGSYGINNGNVGLRVRPFGKLLVTASVLLKLDNGGLRSEAIPLASATYTFR
jgi:Putative MetA-pathway of phenol degradation